MKRFILLLAVFVLVPLNSFAQKEGTEEGEVAVPKEEEKVLNYGAEVDFISRYVWRGLAWSDGPVMQPSAWIGAYGFELSVWSNFVLNEEANQGEFNEVDIILNYIYEFGKLAVEPHFEYWFYPNQDDSPSTGELSLNLAYNFWGPFSAFTNQAFDIKEYTKAYFGELGITYEDEFFEKLVLSGQLSFGWGSSMYNETYVGVAKTAVDVVNFNLSIAYYPVKYFFLRPHMELSVLMDDELRENVEDRTIVCGGMALGMEF